MESATVYPSMALVITWVLPVVSPLFSRISFNSHAGIGRIYRRFAAAPLALPEIQLPPVPEFPVKLTSYSVPSGDLWL